MSIPTNFLSVIILILIFSPFKTKCVEIFELGQYNCTCVPYFQCSDETGSVITDGSGLLDYRKYSNTCTGEFDVCCKAIKAEQEEENFQSLIQFREGCGFQKSNGIMPWLAAMYHQENKRSKPVFQCTVTLIHKKVALTVAHCLPDDGILTVYLREVPKNIQENYGDIQEDLNIFQENRKNFQEHPKHTKEIKKFVVKSIKHPLYNFNSLHFDITLLILDTPFQNSPVICLPPPTLINFGSDCTVGTLNGPQNNILKSEKVSILFNDKCERKLRKTRLGRFFQLHQSFFCAEGEQKNHDLSCGGTGGSPLICKTLGDRKSVV